MGDKKRGRPKKEPEIKTYYLSPEELEYYRNLKPYIPERYVATTAHQGKKRKR